MLQTKYGIDCENLDLYFAAHIKSATKQAIESVPKDVSYRIFRAGAINERRLTKIPFLEKIYVLWKCLRKRIWIVIEDEQGGLSPEEFFKLKDAVKARDLSIEKAEELKASATFVTGNKELCDTFAYLNSLSVSSAYNFISRAKNKSKNNTDDWKEKMKYICKFLAFYESKKRVWINDGMSIPEWFVLLALYHGNEMAGSPLHKEVFKKAPVCSPGRIKLAFGSLQRLGYIDKIGRFRYAKFRITPLGTDEVNRILMKYALNC